jgi:hypothetical protein
MSPTLLQHLLRATATVILLAGWLDPSLAGRSRARVALIDMTGMEWLSSAVVPMVPPRPTGLAPQFASVLGDSVTLTTRRDPTADAWIVVGDANDAEPLTPPPGVPLWLVMPRPSPGLTIDRLDIPTRVDASVRVPVSVTLTAHGLKGFPTTLAVRSGGLVLARLTHSWTADPERFVAQLDVTPPRRGANSLRVEVLEGAGASPRSHADGVVVVDDRRWPVLVFEGRPSWTTTFARRTLESDTRFAVTHATRVSRGITAGASAAGASAPATARTTGIDRLTAATLEPFALAIVGAPESLTAGEVAALRTFVARGSALVLAPDQRPTGAYVSLLGGAAVEERLLEEPVSLGLSGSGPGVALLASELAVVRALPPGARPLSAVASGATAPTGVWIAPWKQGQTLFIGALDAWRFRGRGGDAFDRWWPLVVAWLAGETPEPLTITTRPDVASPGQSLTVQVRLRDIASIGASTTVEATLAAPESTGTDGSATQTVRLWPGTERGLFVATLNAPIVAGVYAVSVRATTAGSARQLAATTPLIVASDARQARSSGDRWTLATKATGGGVVSIDDVSTLGASLQPRTAPVRASQTSEPVEQVRPMRSAWWLLPLVVCLGGEWWLRRRSGQR